MLFPLFPHLFPMKWWDQMPWSYFLVTFKYTMCMWVTQSCPTLRDLIICPWNSLGKHTGVGCHSLLQGTFPIQGWNPGLLHRRQSLYQLSRQGSLEIQCCALHHSLHAAQQSWSSFIFTTGRLHPLIGISPPPNTPVPGRYCSTLLPLGLVCSDSMYKWNHFLFVFLCGDYLWDFLTYDQCIETC